MPVLPFYQVDAFAAQPFEGNQACIMPLEAFLPDETLQKIAAENNVAETAYLVAAAEGVWQLRWFTPAVEVPLCGHATLASAHILFETGAASGDTIRFDTRRSGRLTVRRLGDGRLEMDFPSAPIRAVPVSDEIADALGSRPLEAWAGIFCAARFASPQDICRLSPDIRRLKTLGAESTGWDRGNFGCFALGGEGGVDVTSRFFAPGSGIDEDPATGSWHTMLARILAEHFALPEGLCYQAFPGRGARIGVRLEGDRCKLTGRSVTVVEGMFRL
jgi:PhzF family phenazine biosynthesis protein